MARNLLSPVWGAVSNGERLMSPPRSEGTTAAALHDDLAPRVAAAEDRLGTIRRYLWSMMARNLLSPVGGLVSGVA